jgi:hypothetical protein
VQEPKPLESSHTGHPQQLLDQVALHAYSNEKETYKNFVTARRRV